MAIVDLFSRSILSWKLSNSLDTEFCLDAHEMALGGGRKPAVFHSDQSCQFTFGAFVARLQAEAIKISWSGRERCYDNILVERLWRPRDSTPAWSRAEPSGRSSVATNSTGSRRPARPESRRPTLLPWWRSPGCRDNVVASGGLNRPWPGLKPGLLLHHLTRIFAAASRKSATF